MNRRLGLIAAATALAVLAVAVFFVQSGPKRKEGADSASAGATAEIQVSDGALRPDPRTTPSPASPGGSVLDDYFARLQGGRLIPSQLDELRRQLLAMNPDEAAALIRSFLESGKDAPTGEEFAVGAGGALAGAPTFRTFLLDLLGQVSRKSRNPIAAAMSRQVLEQKQSADEWALAMRNVAWMEPQSKPYLASKMREMLSYEPWAADPSPGMLEAFDVIVFSGDPAFVPDLANLVSTGSEALRRASAVALDRLSEMAPLEVMNHLNANPTILSDKPFLRADFYAKADLANPAQRAALEAYLNRTDVTVAEKGKLLQGLATPASFVSENLITQTPPPDDGAARQKQLTELLTQWQAQNRFPQLRGAMADVQQRIGR